MNNSYHSVLNKHITFVPSVRKCATDKPLTQIINGKLPLTSHSGYIYLINIPSIHGLYIHIYVYILYIYIYIYIYI